MVFSAEKAEARLGIEGIQVPLLAGPGVQTLLSVERGKVVESEGLVQLRSPDLMAGVVREPFFPDREDAAYRGYRRILGALDSGFRLYRLWNFVPGINESVEGMENYRAFNVGRWRAYEGGDSKCEASGQINEARLPAASAVGLSDATLVIAFVAGKFPVRFFENPNQIPAYQYPPEHGPRPPCFARGAVVGVPEGPLHFLSGTSSILGHHTIKTGDLHGQFETSFANVRTMMQAMGIEQIALSNYRVYLRRKEDIETVRDLWNEAVGVETAGNTCFLQADICRRDLDIEIEASGGGGGWQC